MRLLAMVTDPASITRPLAAVGKPRLYYLRSDPAGARDFIERYVEGREVPDCPALLERAGLVPRQQRPKSAWIGAQVESSGETARVAAPVLRGSPARVAGLAQDDVIVTLGGRALRDGKELSRLLERRAPGDVLPVRFLRRGRLVETEAQREFREAWLGSRR